MNSVICRSEQRRNQVREKAKLFGLDYLEFDENNPCLLRVYFLGKIPCSLKLDAANVLIEGGACIQNIRVTEAHVLKKYSEIDDCMEVTVDRCGDGSVYTLRMVQPRKSQLPVIIGKNNTCPDQGCLPEKDAAQAVSSKNTQQKERWIPHPDFDPIYSSIAFRFQKEEEISEFDCQKNSACSPQPPLQEPNISYLAKDYASFRQLILDRMSLTMPEWQERHVPDIGVALAEILAYVGDHLSYYQDAVATEAYLDTARQRISVRRHARLVDYTMHEGCNARAWVAVAVNEDCEIVKGNYFITGIKGAKTVLSSDDLRQVQFSQYEVFEPVFFKNSKDATCDQQKDAAVQEDDEKIFLKKSRNEISFYSWGNQECWLPKGATSATLIDGIAVEQATKDTHFAGQNQEQVQVQQTAPVYLARDTRKLDLQIGDVLLFEEMKGPKTGKEADANPQRRHAVRLISVVPSVDKLTETPLIEIVWAKEDALPFPLCISAMGPAPECELVKDVSIARGNIILVDHGRTVNYEFPEAVPLKEEIAFCKGIGYPSEKRLIAGRYCPSLSNRPLTFSQPVKKNMSASALLAQYARKALPLIKLFSFNEEDKSYVQLCPDQQVQQEIAAEEKTAQAVITPAAEKSGLEQWCPQVDLLASGPNDRHFVVEIDNDGRAHLRFGDDELGEQPDAGLHFQAEYRVGNGLAGNVGAEAIAHLVSERGVLSVSDIRNPLPAQGGTAAETMDEVRLFAPQAFLKEQRRAVIADDYAAIIERDFKTKVQRAVARLRWNGSWHEVLIAVDPLGAEKADDALLKQIKKHLHPFRRIGHELAIKSAERVPVRLAMTINVQPTYLRGHVKAALLELFSNRILPDGHKGLFHPDNLTFGDGIRVSKLIAEAQKVAGVESAQVTTLERRDMPLGTAIEEGILPIDAFAVAQIEKPDFKMEGGRN